MHVCQCHHLCETAVFCTASFSTVPRMALLSTDWKLLFSRALAYESYWRLTTSMPSSIFMNTNGWEHIPEIKKMLCRNETAAISQKDPHWRTPGYWYLGLAIQDLSNNSQHCLPARQIGRMEDPFKHWLSLTNSSWNFKERRCFSMPCRCCLFLCQRLRNCICLSSKPSIMSMPFLHLGINAKSWTS